MKHILITVFVLGIALSATAQTLTIKDQQTGKAIEGATLLSDKSSKYSITNAQGQTDIKLFTETDKIQIHSFGYKTLTTNISQLQKLNFQIQMEQSPLNLNEVVVSGTRSRQTAADVPSKIASITPLDVALQNPQTAADLLGISGKVYIQKSQQGGGSPMIRGFATNRLIYTVDGVRMNTAIFRSGNIQNVINLDPFATEKTEVLFGPGSVIYGSDAIGGVMSFQTLTPQLSLEEKPLVTGKATMRYASANKEKTGHFDVGVGWNKWAMVTSFSSWDFDHLKQGSHGPDDYIKNIYTQREDSADVIITQQDPLLQIPSAYSQMNLMQKVRFKPNEQWDFQYGFHYSETSPYGRYDRNNRYRNGTLRYAEWNYGPQTWMMNNLSIMHAGSNLIYDEMSIRLAAQKFEESRIDRSLNKDERNTQAEVVDAYSINIDFSKTTHAKNTLFYGAEYVFNDVSSTGTLTDITTATHQNGPSRYPQSTWASMGFYLNDQYKVNDKFLLQAGLRYNLNMLDAKFDTTFYPFPFTEANTNNDAITGSIGLIYKPTNKWIINANAGTAFRAPNVDDVGKVFDSEPGSVVVPNTKLEAEYAYNFDLDIARIFGDVVKVDVSGFYTILQNAMVRRDFQLNGQDSILYSGEMSKVQAIQNASKAHVYGVQAGIEVKLPADFIFVSDLNYHVGEEELDDGTKSPLRHAAPFFGITRLRYQKNKLTLELNTAYQGQVNADDMPEEEKAKTEIYAKDDKGNNFAPSWYTINLKAMYQLNDGFSVSGGLENITDQRYRPYSSGISGAGRNFMLSLSAHF
jgi:hemoglobin/transferrin/lactoferrin receptor protein